MELSGVSPQEGPHRRVPARAGASFGAIHADALKERCHYTHGWFLAAGLFPENVCFPGRESVWVAAVGDGIPMMARVGRSSQDPLPKFGVVHLI